MSNLFRLPASNIVPLEYDQSEVSELLAENKSKDEIVAALQSIGRKGEGSAVYFDYAADVAHMLKNRDPEILAAACEALGQMGQAADNCVGDIADLLNSTNADVRVAAANALGMLGASAASSVERLKEMMDSDKDEGAKCAAIGALGQLCVQEHAEPIAALLTSSSPVVVAAAVQALGELDSAGEERSADIAQKLDDPQVRYAALCALSTLGQGTCEKYMDEIISKCLTDKDSQTRVMASDTIGSMPDPVANSPGSMKKLVELLKHEHCGVRCSAAVTLGHMGGRAAEQAEAIAPLLDANEDDLSELYLVIGGGSMRSVPTARRPKCAALYALGQMGARSHADACADCLSDNEWEVKMCALECLGLLGEAGKEHSSKIAACLEDEVFIVRARACVCLGALKAEDVMHHLPDLFDDKAPTVRAAALEALAEVPDVAQSYSNDVFKLLGDPMQTVQAAAIRCLGSMGETGQSYASIIATKLIVDDPGVCAAACEALGKLGDHGAAFAEEVAENLHHPDPGVLKEAATALGQMGSDGKPFLLDIQELMDSPNGAVSNAATEAVARLQSANGE